ncbi:hypothetical protein RirG_209950 [Rhizophagus irregularis DAOM 197198w]|uniref:Uncharacterized protein n=1 Tax=Rhizophagus irregularis (strain DAOM 197198w) TaxID=1432141 RepID=A0A015IJ23_RHIIW|nr:hypothetical protein RirG_209950 [Rhizophagus irregularis DAOM 197198w]
MISVLSVYLYNTFYPSLHDTVFTIEESFARMDNYRRNPAFGLFEGRFQSNLNTYLKGSGRPQLPFNWTRNGYTWSWEDSTFGKIRY